MTLFRSRPAKIHFVGIGGIGMSGIAEVLLNLGYDVSGSDLKESDTTRRLAALGGVISYGHAAENVREVDVVVISSAIRKDNPEVIEARRRKIPVIPRAEMLAELMRLKYGVAIAGSHGKTTTTSMAAHLLAHAGLDPTAVVGGKVNAFGSNAKLGKGDYMVVEADESDGSFLRIPPTIAIVTNIDPEHLDHWRTPEALRRGFVELREPGALLRPGHPLHRPPHRAVAPAPRWRSGWPPTARATRPTTGPRGSWWTATRSTSTPSGATSRSGASRWRMVGRHNALNALAVVARRRRDGPRARGDARRAPELRAACSGASPSAARRGGVTVVDDYGHHPAEVRATLQGAREGFKRRVVCLFQPHRYTRTRDLMDEFATAFNDADVLLLTDIYAAGEEPIAGAGAADLAEAIRACGHRDVTLVPRAELARVARERVRPGDLVLTLGAGDITAVGPELLGLLGK